MNWHPLRTRCLLLIALLTQVVIARGQFEPEEETPAPKQKPAAQAGIEPTIEKRTPAVEAALEEIKRIEEDAQEQSQKPSATEIFGVAKLLVGVESPGFAKQILKKLIIRKLSDDELLKLREDHGTQIFLQLALDKDLAPEGRKFADLVLKAAKRRGKDPKHIDKVISGLKVASPEKIQERVRQLIQTHSASALIAVLADESRAKEHRLISYAMSKMGPATIGPLLATLESDNEPLKARAVRILGFLDIDHSIVHLLEPYVSSKKDSDMRKYGGRVLSQMYKRPVTKNNAIELLRYFAQEYFDGKHVIFKDADGMAELWSWDAKKKTSVVGRYPAEAVVMTLAARLAHDLHQLEPKNGRYLRLYITASLEAAKLRGGLDKPLKTNQGSIYAMVAAHPSKVIEDMLDFSLKTGHLAAAMAAAQILGDLGNPEVLMRSPIETRTTAKNFLRMSPLIKALRHSDPRLRFTALTAVMKLDQKLPKVGKKLDRKQPYAGSSFVAEALGFFAGSIGKRRAVVVHPNSQKAFKLAGMLNSVGFDAEPTTNGRRMFQLLRSSPDYELLLVSVNVGNPGINSLLQQLRRDSRTGLLPVGLMAVEDVEADRARFYANQDPLAHLFPEPGKSDLMKYQVDLMFEESKVAFVPPAERLAQASQALTWIIHLTRKPQYLHELRRYDKTIRVALFVPELNPKAAVALSNLGTPLSQRALVEMGSSSTYPLKMRQVSVAALRYSIGRSGVLLTIKEIQRQYERYNQSEDKDEGTQQVLASILDAIEQQKQQEKGPEKKEEKKKATS